MDPIFQLMEMLKAKEDTFANVGYFVSGKVHPKLMELLDKGGGRQKTYPTVGVTHFIAGDGADRDKMDEAKDIFDIPIVSPRWVIYSTHHGKALPASWFLAEGKELFAGLCFTSSGVRGNDLLAAWSLITYHNGAFVRHLTKECTHLITNDPTGQKYKMASERNLPIICLDWLMDSIKAGKRLSERGYDPTLFNPLPHSPDDQQPYLSRDNDYILPRTALSSRFPPLALVTKAIISDKEFHGVEYPQWFKDAEENFKRRKTRGDYEPGEPRPPVPIMTQLNGTDGASTQETQGQALSEPSEPGQGSSVQSPGIPHPDQGPPPVQTETPPQLESEGATQAQGQVQVPPGQGQSQGSVEDSVPTEGKSHSVLGRPSEDRSTQEQLPQAQENLLPKENSRPTATVEQMEIIQMINNDPQIKLQWAHMDQTQRLLLVQKLAQKTREERLRKEMMLKQRQMQMNQFHGQAQHQQNSLPLPSGQEPSRLPIGQAQGGMSSSYSNQELMRLRFPRPQQGNYQPRQVMAGDELNQPYTDTQPQQILFQQPTQQQQQQQSPVIGQGQSRRTIFLTQGNLVNPIQQQQQRQLLVSQHQGGPLIRTDQQPTQSTSQFNPDELPQRIPTSQLPQTPNQKVQAYLQNSIIPIQQEQQLHMTLSSQQHSTPPTHFYGHTNTQPQQRLTLRPTMAQQQQPQQQQQQQTLLVDPQSSPVAQQPRDPFQWSPNSQSQSSSGGSFNSSASSTTSQAPRLISPTGPSVGQRQQRPTEQQQQQQQQWTIRNQTPQLIYTTQPNMPYSQMMNQKTKTALANLLSNRLMGSTTPENPTQGGMVLSRSPSPLAPPPTPSPINPPLQNRVSAGLVRDSPGKPPQPPPTLQQRRLSTLNNNEKGSLPNNNTPMTSPILTPPPPPSPSPSPAYPSQSARFFGHDPTIKLPDEGFLLGCVFWAGQEIVTINWRAHVVKYGGEVERSYSPRVTHVLANNQKFPQFQQCVRERKRLVSLFWLNDVVRRRILLVPSQAVHLPLPFTEDERPYYEALASISGFSEDEKSRIDSMCSLLGLRVTSPFTRSHTVLIAKSPEGEKFLKAREWKKPVVNIQFLNELLFGHTGVIPMIHSPKYQQFNTGAPFSFDVALVAPLMAPWKTPLRLSSEAVQNFLSSKPDEVESPAAKRRRIELDELFPPSSLGILSSKTPPPPPSVDGLPEVVQKGLMAPHPEVIVMFTSFSIEMRRALMKKVEELGGGVTNDRQEATHLVVDRARFLTNNLVLFLGIKERIVWMDWLRDSYVQKKFLPVDPYLLGTVTIGIHKINFHALSKIPNRHRLFTGLVFYVTPTARRDMQVVIEAYGGRMYVEHSMRKVYEAAVKSTEFVVVACKEDEYLLSAWKRKEGVDKIIIVNRDIVFTWILNLDRVQKDPPSSSSTVTSTTPSSLSVSSEPSGSDHRVIINTTKLPPPHFDGNNGTVKKLSSSSGELVPFVGNA